ncbi:MAG TPA: phosphodiesterase, partial [Colwellia sp.]|nr:phosphodiesterase [Colwellia sp.]
MNRSNAKYLTLLIIVILIAALSAFFAQLYSDKLPINFIAIVSYIIAVVITSFLALFCIDKIFSKTSEYNNSDAISVDELFSYTHDPTTNLPTAQQAQRAFEAAIKADTGQRYAAVVFKPINFQQVNSLLGYHNSDLLLLQLAYCLQQRIAENTSLLSFGLNPQPVRISRLQSLQFLVIYNLTDSRFDDKSMLNEVCHQLADAVPDAMSFKSFSLNFELAFGIAISGENG